MGRRFAQRCCLRQGSVRDVGVRLTRELVWRECVRRESDFDGGVSDKCVRVCDVGVIHESMCDERECVTRVREQRERLQRERV